MAGTAVAMAGSPLLAGPAAAQQVRTAGHSAPLQLSLNSFSPAFAQPGRTITITGKIRNASSSPVTGLTVAAWSSSTSFGNRTAMQNFAHGTYLPAEAQVVGAPTLTRTQLDAGHSWVFTLRLPTSALGLSCFGVYPLSIQVVDSALQAAREPVPLPYWPSARGCAGAQRPKPFPVSWVWPLIDVPHQGVCPGLTDNSLAHSLGPTGRLGYLLAVGRRYAASAALTWAVDPALLASARAMRGPHTVGFTPLCEDGEAKPPSTNARRWLASLARATSGRPVFATPYADVDMAALAKYGDKAGLTAALAAGNKVTRKILGRAPAPASGQAGPHQLSAIAWPPGGNASEALLDDLAAYGTTTVILTAPATSTSTYTPGAVSSKLAGIGGLPLHFLLADHPINTLLNSRQAASAKADDIFRVSQLYLAQTAMIAAEAPTAVRPIVVAPPRRWNPPRRLASGLLADTVAAPWLKPETAGALTTMPPEHLYPHLASYVSRGELARTFLKQVARLEKRISLLQSIQVRPDSDLNRAVFAIESSAWRGNAGRHAKMLLARTAHYVRSQLAGLSIRGSSGKHSVLHVTFGGRSSSVPVAVFNSLRYPVVVKLRVHAAHATVSGMPATIRVPARSYSRSVKITVHTAKNQTRHGTIKLSLTSVSGRPLPAYPLTIIVHTTDLGFIALVIGSAALALFVIGSATRAIRSSRPGRAAGGTEEEEEEAGPEAGSGMTGPEEDNRPATQGSGLSSPGLPLPAAGDPGLPDPPDPGHLSHNGHDSASRYQRSQAGGEIGAQSLAQPGTRPEHVDSVGASGSELASAGPPVADQEATPGRRGNREQP